jgi:hypothetical protein
MSATTTVIQSASNLSPEHPMTHSYPPTKASSSNVTPALNNPLDHVGASMAAVAAPGDGPTSRMAAIWREKTVFATMCGVLFLAGWNDGTTGPLLPRIQEVYHVRVSIRPYGLSLTSSLPRLASQLCLSSSSRTAWYATRNARYLHFLTQRPRDSLVGQ